MSDTADVFRQRAKHLLRVSSGQTDLRQRELFKMIANSYEALAKNEEWLEGEQRPCERTRATDVLTSSRGE